MKLEIGKVHQLPVIKFTDFGAYLLFNEKEILIPMKYIPTDARVGSNLEVFVYRDSEDRLIASTHKPIVMVGEFANLKVKQATPIGAFLDWGLEKDLFVPFREQQSKMEEGKHYIVGVTIDELTERIIGSAKVNKFLKHEDVDLQEWQQVDILVSKFTEMGANVIINNLYWGLIYKNEIFSKLAVGDRTIGYVKKLREEGKIDISLQKQGVGSIDDNTAFLLEKLKQNKGVLKLSDNSAPEEIYAQLGISKKLFKKALGNLYKQRLVDISGDEIKLLTA